MPKRKQNVVKRKAEKKRGAIPFLRLERRPDNDDKPMKSSGCLNSREHAYAVKATSGHCSHHHCSGAARVTALAGVAGVWASPSL